MKPQRMKEGWVEFNRIPCKEGYIDVWTGDQAHNPNNDTHSQIVLNAFAQYYRADFSANWIHQSQFTPHIGEAMRQLKDTLTSKELWDVIYKPK